MSKRWIWIMALLVAAGGAVGPVHASKGFPSVVDQFFNQGAARNGECSLCHYARGGGLFSWTPFGRQVMEAGGEGLVQRLRRVANFDADGDGVSNLLEFKAASNPNGLDRAAPGMVEYPAGNGPAQVSSVVRGLPFNHN